MIDVGLLAPSGKIPIVSETLGRQAAAAFDASIGDVRTKLLSGIEKGTLSQDDLQEIGEVVHPSRIPEASDEMALLRQFMLKPGDKEKNGQARKDSTWLLLDMFRKGIASDDETAIRRAVYNRCLPDGTPYTATGRTVDLWTAFQANEFCHISLEVILNALIVGLQERLEGQDPRSLIEDTIKSALSSLNAEQVTWENWAGDIGDEYVGKEEQLADPILKALQDTDLAEDCTAVENAIMLLAVLWARWGEGALETRETITRYAGKGGRSLGGVLQTLDAHSSSVTIDTLVQLIRRHVISDHLAIAGRKLATSGTFTYHFTSADGLLSDGRLSTYGYTTPRLGNLIRFIRDANLYNEDGVTAVGERFLNDNQPD